MRGNWISCPRCYRRVAQINPSTAEVEFAAGARLLYPTEGTFTFGDASVCCPQGHMFRVARAVKR